MNLASSIFILNEKARCLDGGYKYRLNLLTNVGLIFRLLSWFSCVVIPA